MAYTTTNRQLVSLVLIVVGALGMLPVSVMKAGMRRFRVTIGRMSGGGLLTAGQTPGWLARLGTSRRLMSLAGVVVRAGLRGVPLVVQSGLEQPGVRRRHAGTRWNGRRRPSVEDRLTRAGLFGVLALPLELPALYEGYRRYTATGAFAGGGDA